MPRQSRDHVSIVFGVLLVALLVPTPGAVAQDNPQRATVSVALMKTARDGTSVMPVSGRRAAAVGEMKRYYFYTTAKGSPSGGSDDKPPEAYVGGEGVKTTVVGGRVVTSRANAPAIDYDYLWQVDVKAVLIALDLVTFDLDWTRTDVKDGARQAGAGDHRTITLRQGEKHLLDFVSCSPDAPCANLFLEVQAAPVEDSSAAETNLGYDLWLVHQTAGGGKITRHALVNGRQGEKVSFDFASVPLQLDAATGPDADSPYRLHINGTIVGRVKADGTMEIVVSPVRRERSPTGSTGLGAGARSFTCKPGETTSVVLPPVAGGSKWRAEPGFKLRSPRPGVTMSGDSVITDLKEFFQTTETSILVTVRQER
jgi:hypothetical protein